MLRQLLVFIHWLPKHLVFWFASLFKQNQLGCLGYLPLTAAPVLLTGCYSIPVVTWPFPPYPPREVEGFPRGEKCFKHVSPLIYLIYFSPKGLYMVGSTYMPKLPHGTLNHWFWTNVSKVWYDDSLLS